MKVKLNGNYSYEVSSPFGVTDSVHRTAHTGIDLVMEEGTRLFSPVKGVVDKIVDYGNDNIGKGVRIKTDTGETVIMGHMSDTSSIHVGDNLNVGGFVGLSGNTGHSTGAHLHLGLKDKWGNIINPDRLLAHEELNQVTDKSWFQFLNDWRKEGFWHAMYDKSFFEVMKDGFTQLFHDASRFVLENSDLFFLLPAIVLMFGTFFVGKNKYSKYIIPLWFGYFVTSILNKIYM